MRLTRIFARRMGIEEYFRDTKSKRNGFGLRLTLIRCPRRLERLLLVLALAYWLLVATGGPSPYKPVISSLPNARDYGLIAVR